MAGKDYKVQKKAKEQQRLSVFQPAFRWGGNNNNASSSSGSSSKIEAKKSDRLEVSRNDKLDRRIQNERVNPPRRNDNRLPIQEDPEAKMARDAKRMTTFQPMFSSLFSSKPSSKGKGPEPPQLSQAQRPLANGATSQHPSRNQVADPARQGAPNNASGSSKGGRSGSGYQNVGINSKRNEAAAGSSGRNGRGGLAPVPEVDSPRPRSPLQRNPAITIPDDDMMPLGISNPFGPGGRAKGKANGASNGLANSTAYTSTGNTKDPRSNGRDRGINNVSSSMSFGSRDASPFLNEKRKDINTEQNAETKRDLIGAGLKRDDHGSASQSRLGATPVRKPVESKSELRMDPRAQPQMDGVRRGDGNLAQQPAERSRNLPQLIVTDTSNVPSRGASSRPDRPSKGQQNMYATPSRIVPDEGRNSARETPSLVRPDVVPSSRTDEVIGKSSKSPLDRIAKTLSSKPTQDTRDVALESSRDESRRGALPKQVFSQAESSKPGLGIFAKNSPTTRQPLVEVEPVKSKMKGLDALRPSLEREERSKRSQVSPFTISPTSSTALIRQYQRTNEFLRIPETFLHLKSHTQMPQSVARLLQIRLSKHLPRPLRSRQLSPNHQGQPKICSVMSSAQESLKVLKRRSKSPKNRSQGTSRDKSTKHAQAIVLQKASLAEVVLLRRKRKRGLSKHLKPTVLFHHRWSWVVFALRRLRKLKRWSLQLLALDGRLVMPRRPAMTSPKTNCREAKRASNMGKRLSPLMRRETYYPIKMAKGSRLRKGLQQKTVALISSSACRRALVSPRTTTCSNH